MSYEFLFNTEVSTAACHLDRMEIYDKVMITYKIPHLGSGGHDNTRDCRVHEFSVKIK